MQGTPGFFLAGDDAHGTFHDYQMSGPISQASDISRDNKKLAIYSLATEAN